MTDFVYKGEPVYDENGIIKYVRRVRGVVAPNGITYRGALAQDSRGNAFVYNKYPNIGITPTIPVLWNDSIEWLDTDIWEERITI